MNKTNEEVQFDTYVYNAWAAIHELYEFLSVCHKGGLLIGIARSPDKVIKDLADVREWLGHGGDGDFELYLDPNMPTAEFATATR
jgi:hypothetical protein